MNFSTEDSIEIDLIIKAATGNIKTRTIRNFLFSLTGLKAVRLNNQGAPLLGLAKSIYYLYSQNDRLAGKRGQSDLNTCLDRQSATPLIHTEIMSLSESITLLR